MGNLSIKGHILHEEMDVAQGLKLAYARMPRTSKISAWASAFDASYAQWASKN